jgi:hypothetical protein
MTNLQTHIRHDGDCSCYQVLIDKDGKSYDCPICDCGALRKVIRTISDDDRYTKEMRDAITKCWLKHIAEIARPK